MKATQDLPTKPQSTTALLRVGDVARESGKSVRAIHLYEELGLLHPATRSAGGLRLFERSAIERVRWIELLNGLGFSLHDIKSVLHRWQGAEHAPEAMAELRSLFARKLTETRENVKRYQQLEVELL